MRKIILTLIPGTVLGLLITASPPSVPAFGGEVLFSEYWSRPVDIGPVKDGPYAESCGVCHESQLKDWKGSLHSKSVGPGLLSQLDPVGNPGFALSCYYCHAPSTVQNEFIGSEGDYYENPAFDRKLKLEGVTCIVCHLRKGKVYGPPVTAASAPDAGKGHPFFEKDFFEKAEFCAACHQMDEGYELNGKVLTNTYREWKESYYGEKGIVCQRCHMPGRRHLFRGIHDPDMTKSGLSFEVSSGHTPSGLTAVLKITNSGVGHYFPTYVTPQVIVRGYMVDADGKAIGSTVKEAVIGRKVALDLSKELFDTRIPPLESFYFRYPVDDSGRGRRIVFEVRVYPDEFYNRFFRAFLKNVPPERRDLTERAVAATESSAYLLYKTELEPGVLR